ncbi:MAG: bifunctional metallophosphatase/5'-nucleotidase [Bacteroidetes bacterium]|nr:MAG: bifunctional metallophosphatase/5'-nucleotidase [Bacteroidota bacterium]
MQRRTFLKQIGATTFLIGSGLPTALAFDRTQQTTTIHILHTNDWHSRIDPFPADSGRFAGLGGAIRRAQLLEQLRSELPYKLLLDSGDIFQGTPYFNFYEGELEFKLMSAMQYDLATIGNHDFDAGISKLAQQMRYALFDFVNCNYVFNNTPLQGRIKPYRIFTRGPIKIGILGVGIELEGLVAPSLYGDTLYLDPIETVNATARLLKEEEACDLVICLSHLGYKYRENKVSDHDLAAASSHLDIILGGHTHTFLDEPTVVLNQRQQPVLINQVGWGGVCLGHIDVTFDEKRGKKCVGCKNEWIGV